MKLALVEVPLELLVDFYIHIPQKVHISIHYVFSSISVGGISFIYP